jgi:hypothetical protein
VLHGFAGSRCCMSVNDVDERSFPIRCSDPEEILSHFLRVRQRRWAVADQRMNFRQKHGSPHAVEFGSRFRSVPGRRVRGIEHLLVLRGAAALHRKLPGSIVACGSKPAVPHRCVFRSCCVTQNCFPFP